MNQVTLVTSPDDVLHDGIRIVLVNLTGEQTQILSEALLSIESLPPIVLYVWQTGDPVEWLFDKRLKSNSIIFNADSDNDLVTGYIAAQLHSFYFGTLKELGKINNRAIYSIDDLKNLLTTLIRNYGL